jgi:hypothetical protein
MLQICNNFILVLEPLHNIFIFESYQIHFDANWFEVDLVILTFLQEYK